MDRLDAMAVLVAIVEAGSFSAAGRKLGMPLATVSRKISDLEAHLRTRLLNRSSRNLTLTDAGEGYAATARRVLELVSEGERAAAGEYSAPMGHLTITTPIVFGRLHVLPIAVEFLQAHAEITIRLVQTDGIADLLEEHIDLAVRIGELPDSSFKAVRVGSIRRVVCASPEYLARRGIPQKPEELARHDCISFERLAAPGSWTFGKAPAETDIQVKPRLLVTTAEAAIDAAIAGAGVTRLLSYQVADAIAAGKLVTVLEGFEPTPWPVSLVHAGQGLLPLKVRAFADFAAPRLRSRLQQVEAAGARAAEFSTTSSA